MSAFAQTLPGAGGRLVRSLDSQSVIARDGPIDPSLCQPLTSAWPPPGKAFFEWNPSPGSLVVMMNERG